MSFSKNVKATDVAKEMEEKIIEIRRVAKVTRGKKTMSFRVVAVVGNKNGKVGVGIGNAREVPQAIRKAIQDAKKNVKEVPIKNGTRYMQANKLALSPSPPATAR